MANKKLPQIVFLGGYSGSGKTQYASPALEQLGYVKASSSDALHQTVQGIVKVLLDIDIDTYDRKSEFLKTMCHSSKCASHKDWSDLRQLNIDIAEEVLIPIFGREIMAFYLVRQMVDCPTKTSVFIETVGGDEFAKTLSFAHILFPEFECLTKARINIRRHTEKPGIDLRKLLPDAITVWNEGSYDDLVENLKEVLING